MGHIDQTDDVTKRKSTAAPVSSGHVIEIAPLDRRSRYDLMNQIIVPRPIAWVSSASTSDPSHESVWNLAPFSYFNAVSSDPPTIFLGINSRDHTSGIKDTVRNIRTNLRFTISIPSADMAVDVARSAAETPWGVSEANVLGIRLQPVPGWPVPRVLRTKIAMNCRLLKEVDIDDSTQSLLLASVESVWLDSTVAEGDTAPFTINLEHLDPLARAGRMTFIHTTTLDSPSPTTD